MSKRKKGKAKVAILVSELLLLAIVVTVLVVYLKTFAKIDYVEMDDTEAGINTDIEESTLLAQDGYTNIALFGLDNRSSGKYEAGNSDTIMICSINNETKDVKLVSVYRDTYLSVGSGNFSKANAAFAKGGVTQAVAMLNSNLDLAITDYVCVDWAAVTEAIDALGGIDLEITDKEASQINKHKLVVEKAAGYTSSALYSGGEVHLDGVQATTYARIRHTAGDDYKRASRQRIVLQAMLEKAKDADVATLTKICSSVFDDISTTLSLTEILGLATKVTEFNIVETTGFPFELTNATLKSGDTVVPVELDNNVVELHEFLFDDTNYVLSDTVQSISDSIAYSTGVTDASSLVDTSSYNDTTGKKGTE